MENYIPRLIETSLKLRLKLYGGVLIVGPKWCGKSTTAKQYAQSILEMQNPKAMENNLETAKLRPDLLLEGNKPRLIDEWQEAPTLWDAIRYDVDNTGKKNQYILTGSVTPRENKPRHSGTGRIIRLTMRTMSLYESGESTGEVSLNSLFNEKDDIKGISKYELEDIAFFCARGGWPESLKVSRNDSIIIAKDYLNSIIENDIKSITGTNTNSNRLKSVLRSLARHICTNVNISTIRDDVSYNDSNISDKTIKTYLNALNELFVLENIEAWHPKLRSKTDIRTTPKRSFVDPSIAVAALHASDKDLLKDIRSFGFIFESLCIRDLKIYANSLEGDVYFYKDKTKLECDAIIHLNNGKWGAIEIKLGSEDSINLAAKNLIKLSNIVDTEEMNKPSFLMILTAGKYAYKREDGILVVPITTLKN